MDNVAKAELRVRAAKLRTLAAGQRQQEAGYRRQATKPIYPGQEGICLGKAGQVGALAAKNMAQADLLDAQAAAMED